MATADRSERGILEPIIRRLEILHAERKIVFELVQGIEEERTKFYLSDDAPDVILIPADRREMVELAMFCFYKRIPVFHMWAGVGTTGTWDDVNRRVISSFAYLMLCEDMASKRRLVRWGEEPWRVVVVGTTHFDDLKVDESLVPKKPYDLILFNPNPAIPGDYERGMDRAFAVAGDRTVQVGGTGLWADLGKGEHNWYSSLPRPKFLGLLKNCDRFISNSSAGVYEAPYFGVRVINPGERNARRTTNCARAPGAADRVVDVLRNYPISQEKMLKVYR